jgi:hypothetical protein
VGSTPAIGNRVLEIVKRDTGVNQCQLRFQRLGAGAVGLRFGPSRLQNGGDGENEVAMSQTGVALTWTLCRTQVSSRR